MFFHQDHPILPKVDLPSARASVKSRSDDVHVIGHLHQRITPVEGDHTINEKVKKEKEPHDGTARRTKDVTSSLALYEAFKNWEGEMQSGEMLLKHGAHANTRLSGARTGFSKSCVDSRTLCTRRMETSFCTGAPKAR